MFERIESAIDGKPGDWPIVEWAKLVFEFIRLCF